MCTWEYVHVYMCVYVTGCMCACMRVCLWFMYVHMVYACACLYMYNIFKNTKIKPAKNIQLFCFCNLCELQPEELQPTEVRPSDSPVYIPV